MLISIYDAVHCYTNPHARPSSSVLNMNLPLFYLQVMRETVAVEWPGTQNDTDVTRVVVFQIIPENFGDSTISVKHITDF